jgi:hypothetical protein
MKRGEEDKVSEELLVRRNTSYKLTYVVCVMLK